MRCNLCWHAMGRSNNVCKGMEARTSLEYSGNSAENETWNMVGEEAKGVKGSNATQWSLGSTLLRMMTVWSYSSRIFVFEKRVNWTKLGKVDILEPVSPFSFAVLIYFKLFVNVLPDPLYPKHDPQGNVSQLTGDYRHKFLTLWVQPSSKLDCIGRRILASPRSSPTQDFVVREVSQAQDGESRGLCLLTTLL